MRELLASILRYDAVVSREMHIAVDLDNALEHENRLDDGSGALRRHSLQAPILDEVLVDDDVHVVSRLSGLTQLLDANVTE